MSNLVMMSVTALNTKIKSLLESTFLNIAVEGEVSSATYHTSGHLYFSIKDKESTLRCVMFKSSVAKLKFKIEIGMHIIVGGAISIFVPRGEYQLYAQNIEPFGQGALALAYEQLKEKLKNKGYFDAIQKKSLPKFIRSLCLVTAKESAALHDMMKIIEKRWPLLEVTIVDTLVQGESAPQQIAKAIKYADTLSVDVVVVARGGGSKEDLWAFNTEEVADALHFATTPMVSAIGHEVDVMISDFVADLRAPTPSAAMEMILPDKFEYLELLSNLMDDMKRNLVRHFDKKEQIMRDLSETLKLNSPKNRLEAMDQRYKQTKDDFQKVIEFKLALIDKIPYELLANLKNIILHRIAQKETFVGDLLFQYQNFNPKERIQDGYAQVVIDGKVAKLSTLKKGDEFVLQDKESKVVATCTGIEKL